jgi:hypothetical protein
MGLVSLKIKAAGLWTPDALRIQKDAALHCTPLAAGDISETVAWVGQFFCVSALALFYNKVNCKQ